jgi:hypothetical protein
MINASFEFYGVMINANIKIVDISLQDGDVKEWRYKASCFHSGKIMPTSFSGTIPYQEGSDPLISAYLKLKDDKRIFNAIQVQEI